MAINKQRSMIMTLPNFDQLWNYDRPDETEHAFRALLPLANPARDHIYLLQLQTQIARTYSLRGQFERAHAALDEVEPHVKIAPIVEIRYLLERGRTFNSEGERTQAAPLFERAWQIGRDAGEDFYAVDAAHMLAIALPGAEDQVAWNEKGLALAEQSDQPRAKNWLGALYNNLGWTYHDAGEYARALDCFQKGLAWREQQGGIAPLRVARWTVGRALRSLGRVDEALRIQQALLVDYQAAGETDGFVLEELAECLHALNRTAEAKSYFARAYETLANISWIEPERLARLKSLASIQI